MTRRGKAPLAIAAMAVVCLALFVTPARAQVLIGYLFGEKLASPTFNMGFEVGMNFATLSASNRPNLVLLAIMSR